MSANYFLDTNILVYTFDVHSPAKQVRARALVEEALVHGYGTISTQVIQEFLNVAIHKFRPSLGITDTQTFLRQVLHPLCRVFPNLALYELGLELQSETGYSFYDALIVAGAITTECDTLYTEDLQDGQIVRGVLIRNPFANPS